MQSKAAALMRGIMQSSKDMENEGNQKLNDPSVVRKLAKFFDIIFGGTAKEVGGIAEDWAKYYRYKNLLKIQDKVEKIIGERNLTGKTTPLPRGLAIEIIESSSKEEDDDLQNLWAGLIANSTDSSSPIQVRKVFLQVLKSMDPVDAKILSWFKRQGWNNDLGKIDLKVISEEFSLNEKETNISISNLNLLGVVESGGIYSRGSKSTESSVRVFKITQLGWYFLEACND